jgi:hypothetical protein
MNDLNISRIELGNKFGVLYLTPIMNYVPVKDISLIKCPNAENHLISSNKAAKVALISENRNIQICFPMNKTVTGLAYVVYHNTTSTAAICSVEIAHFETGDNLSALEKIDDMALADYGHFTCY